MEKKWTPEELQDIQDPILIRWSSATSLVASQGAQEKLRSITRIASNMSSSPAIFNSLPTETVISIAEHLAFDDIQPYLGDDSLLKYQEAQNSLRNLSLVSKILNDVARPQLYRVIVVDNADVLVKLVRTMIEQKVTLGQHVKALVLQVPFDDEDERFTAPDLTTFLKCNDLELSTMAEHQFRDGHGWSELGKLYFHVIKWTPSLRTLFLKLRMPNNGTVSANLMYMTFWRGFFRSATLPSHFSTAAPFLPELTTVSLAGELGTARGQIDTDFVRRVLDLPSVKTLVVHRDDGVWYDLEPTQSCFTMSYHRLRGSYYYHPNLKSLELQRSACTPLDIIDICIAFPNLQSLSVSTDCWDAKRKRGDPFVVDNKTYLSNALARLPDLKTLILDLHYNRDFTHHLGPRGVLNLRALSKLENLVVPLHYLVEKTLDGGDIVAFPSAVLPPSLKDLDLKTDRMCLAFWRIGAPGPGLQFSHAPTLSYKSATTLLKFLGAVNSCVPYYFTNLEQATYSVAAYNHFPMLNHEVVEYTGPSGEMPAFPLDALGLPEDAGDNLARFGVLAEDFERNSVSFKVLVESSAH